MSLDSWRPWYTPFRLLLPPDVVVLTDGRDFLLRHDKLDLNVFVDGRDRANFGIEKASHILGEHLFEQKFPGKIRELLRKAGDGKLESGDKELLEMYEKFSPVSGPLLDKRLYNGMSEKTFPVGGVH